MQPYYADKSITLYHGDCQEVLPNLDPVDLVLTDPPYYKVKNEEWDRQWASPQAFLEWLDGILGLIYAKLKANGSLYCFASPQMSARVECLIGQRFNVLNHIIWRKGKEDRKSGSRAHRADKEILRAFFPETERIIFAEHYGADSYALGQSGYQTKCDELRGFVFEPLRLYLRDEWQAACLSAKDLNSAVGSSATGGGMASHYIGDTLQWALPTAEHYENLKRYANTHGKQNGGYFVREYEDLRREYEDLRREYEDLRREYEDLRRPFTVDPIVPYTDVWDFKTVSAYEGKHPCEKPQALIQHMIRCSSRKEATVLDCFAGSGSTLRAAKALGRRAIGIEKSEAYCEMIAEHCRQEVLSF